MTQETISFLGIFRGIGSDNLKKKSARLFIIFLDKQYINRAKSSCICVYIVPPVQLTKKRSGLASLVACCKDSLSPVNSLSSQKSSKIGSSLDLFQPE